MSQSKIELRPSDDDKCTVIYPEPFTEIRGRENIAALRRIVAREPYNLPAVLDLAQQLLAAGEVEEACRTHFEGCQLAIEAIPDDEDIMPVDWEDGQENQAFGIIFGATGLDLYHMGDFELAAGMFETALDLDPEDHYQVTPLMAYCYIMLEEWELLDETLFDIPTESMDYQLINALTLYKKGKEPDPKKVLPTEILNELRAPEHPEIINGGGGMSKSDQVRALWFRAQPVLLASEEFLEAAAR